MTPYPPAFKILKSYWSQASAVKSVCTYHTCSLRSVRRTERPKHISSVQRVSMSAALLPRVLTCCILLCSSEHNLVGSQAKNENSSPSYSCCIIACIRATSYAYSYYVYMFLSTTDLFVSSARHPPPPILPATPFAPPGAHRRRDAVEAWPQSSPPRSPRLPSRCRKSSSARPGT